MERVTGDSFFSFLAKRVLLPLGMTSAIDLDEQTLGLSDAAGYTRFAWDLHVRRGQRAAAGYTRLGSWP